MRLAEFNALSAEDAAAVVSVWAAIPAWTDEIVSARPFATVDDIVAAAEGAAARWDGDALEAALAHHPRIGSRPLGDDAEAEASRREQASMSSASPDLTARMAAGNAAYEKRFGRVFLIRAAGRSPDEMLAELERRLANGEEDEERETLDQLYQIAVLRLRSTFAEDAESAHVTTHVLDATTGTPAVGVAVSLGDASGDTIAAGVTDSDGRLALGPSRLPAGDYTVSFATGAYFADRGQETFYPSVTICFTVASLAHCHVPLLLSPFSYSTYRGS